MNQDDSNSQPSQPTNQNKGKLVRATLTQSVRFSGPLPPPEILERYEKIVPGSAERIIKMAEGQSSHRKELEIKVITSKIHNSKLGLWFGLIIGIVALISSMVMVVFGHAIAGSAIGILYLASLVGTFVYGSQGKDNSTVTKKEENEK